MADRIGQYARIAVVGLAVVVVLSLGVGAATSSASFSAYNSAWNGAADVQPVASETGATFSVATEVETAYREPNSTVSIILSPDQAYTRAEAQRVREFVEQGGTIIVADDFGPHTNPLLSALGSDVRIDGRLLRDEQQYATTPNFSEATTTPNATFLDTDQTLTLNHGSALRANGTTVLARSSEFSYVDSNRNYQLDDSEALQSRPIAMQESVGDGTIIVVSDPSMFINAMLEREGNRAFVTGLLEPHDRVVADYSHTEQIPPLAGFVLWLQRTPVAQVGFGAIALALVGVVVFRPRQLVGVFDRKTEPTPVDADALRAYLASQHPDWDETELGRVMTGVMPEETNLSEDD
ncbi:DUF4350 domain-containing protein [Halogeometricum borinquense]|uniref:DUF4350 domain-containing protein n=1 Tax=Halogeometricum borinquense TaxID=60847 RepID=A0A6C0UJC2_9EURY|nr:DUF4350 domain-containing protein [Halogeometricum borinquense]QIB75535.1 DUF4350 domain-containing protein [Halogeometricum borinquense]